jgi:hypothetical protein
LSGDAIFVGKAHSVALVSCSAGLTGIVKRKKTDLGVVDVSGHFTPRREASSALIFPHLPDVKRLTGSQEKQ